MSDSGARPWRYEGRRRKVKRVVFGYKTQVRLKCLKVEELMDKFFKCRGFRQKGFNAL